MNSIADGAFKQLWMAGVQDELDKALVAKGIASTDTRASRIFHNPFNSTPIGSNGARQGTYSVETMTSTDDTLTVNQRATAAEQIDSYEQLMTSYDLMSQQAQRQAFRISDYIDQYVLNMPVSKTGVRKLDNGIISGSASDGAPYVTSSSNINTVATTISQYIALGNGALSKGVFWVVSPYEMGDITAYCQAHGFNLQDSAIAEGYNGSVGKKFGGLTLYQSNNLTHTTTIKVATNPTTAVDTLTFTINGRTITLTFRSSPTTAGDVKIGGSASATQANLKAMLNGSGTGDGSDYMELAAADRAALKMASPQSAPGTFALCGTFTSNIATLTVYGSLVVSSSLTAGAPDGFTTVIRHTIAGVHGRELVTAQVYDATIWNNQKIEVLDVLLG